MPAKRQFRTGRPRLRVGREIRLHGRHASRQRHPEGDVDGETQRRGDQ